MFLRPNTALGELLVETGQSTTTSKAGRMNEQQLDVQASSTSSQSTEDSFQMMDPDRCKRKDWDSFCSLLSCHSWSQENSPIGSKVLQLILSDPDSPENGPPYSFRITKGNDGSAFRVTPDGWLVTAEGLSRRAQEWYQLQIQVRAVLGFSW